MDPLVTWSLGSTRFTMRRAVADDVPAIVDLLANDPLGARRDSGLAADSSPYWRAFETIAADPAQLLLVVTTDDAAVAGTMQVTLTPGMGTARRFARAGRGGPRTRRVPQSRAGTRDDQVGDRGSQTSRVCTRPANE